MMIDKDFDDFVLNDFLEAYEEEDQVEEDQVEEDQVEEDQQQYNVYQLNSTVVQSTSSFFDTALDDLPVLDVCFLFVFAVCVFLLFNLFNGGSGNVRFD